MTLMNPNMINEHKQCIIIALAKTLITDDRQHNKKLSSTATAFGIISLIHIFEKLPSISLNQWVTGRKAVQKPYRYCRKTTYQIEVTLYGSRDPSSHETF